MKAESCGAKCSRCPLVNEDFAAPEKNPNANIAVVLDSPESKQAFEMIFGLAINNAGAKRGQFHITMNILCKETVETRATVASIKSENRNIRKENKNRQKNGEPLVSLLETPEECCAPRLRRELEDFSDIIPMGNKSIKAIVHESASVMDLRGAPTTMEIDGKTLRILPTLNPSIVMSSPKWREPFMSDIAKAVKWFERGLDWNAPEIIYHPSAEYLREFLWQDGVPIWTYDVETDGIDSLTANLRCIGIGTTSEVVIIGLLGIDGFSKFYSTEGEYEVIKVLEDFFTDNSIVKAGWNSGYYDRLVMESQHDITPSPHIDAMLLHRLIESELPHSLAFAGSMYSDAPSWKTDRKGRKKAFGTETDHELHEYCGMDVAVTAEVMMTFFDKVDDRNQMDVFRHDSELQSVCAETHKIGIGIDQDKIKALNKQIELELICCIATVREIIGDQDGSLNLGSNKQIRELLFDDKELLPYLVDRMETREYLTIGGNVSTSDKVLSVLLGSPMLTESQRLLIQEILKYRRLNKELSSYLHVLKPFSRFHPEYTSHVTTTGAIKSGEMNMKKMPSRLKPIIVPQNGNVFVKITIDDLDLRVASSLWKSRKYLEAFSKEEDVHGSVTSSEILGAKILGTDLSEKEKRIKLLVGEIFSASMYGAEIKDVYRHIKEVSSDDGSGVVTFPFASLTVREVRMMHGRWSRASQYEDHWKAEVDSFRENGFTIDPVIGRRRDFLDGENFTEILEHQIKATSSAVINTVIIDIRKKIAPNCLGEGTGIVGLFDDSILIECPQDKAQWVKKIVNGCITRKFDGLPDVEFTTSTTIGSNWLEASY